MCSVEGCGEKHRAKGFCHSHYNQMPEMRAYFLAYSRTAEARAAQRRLSRSPERLAYQKAYFKKYKLTPEYKATAAAAKKKYRASAYGKARAREYDRSPKAKEMHSRYRQSPKGKAVAVNASHLRRQLQRETDITAEWLVSLRRKTKYCGICLLLLEGHAHLDHIIPLNVGGTHTRENVRYVHCHCNMRRPKDGSDLLPKSKNVS